MAAARSRRRRTPARPLAWRRPLARGFTGWAGGAHRHLDPAPMWRGTSMQVCGLWPFAAGSGAPNIGAPMGAHQLTGEMVCCDVISWFTDAKLIGNPSAFVMSNPAKGKSTMVARMMTCLSDFGVHAMVFGDIRPDYVHLVRAQGGQVIRLGSGTGYLNPLDPGVLPDAIAQVNAAHAAVLAGEVGEPGAAERLRAAAIELTNSMRQRRQLRVTTLIQLSRGQPPTERERNVLAKALELLDAEHPGVPVMADLLAMIRSARRELMEVAICASEQRYREETELLEVSLVGIVSGSTFGDMFSRPTSEPMRLDQAVVFDVSELRQSSEDAQAAALMTCWSYGFGNIGAVQVLADLGLVPRQLYCLVVDELHRVLRAGGGALVEAVDQSTRLNRNDGTGTIFITHTNKDLLSLPREEDRQKAKGFVERAGMVIYGGLPPQEMAAIDQVTPLSEREKQWLTAWATPPTTNPRTGDREDPNKGRFLIKVGQLPGIPFKVELTAAERALRNSNYRWQTT